MVESRSEKRKCEKRAFSYVPTILSESLAQAKFCIIIVSQSSLQGITVVQREIENNGHAKFFGVNKVRYGQCKNGE